MIALRFSRQSLNDRLFNFSRRLFVMEGPAAVLAPVELALVVDGVLYQVKRRPLSAFGADNAVAF